MNIDRMFTTLGWRPLSLLMKSLGERKPGDLVKEYLVFVLHLKCNFGWARTVKICKDLNSRAKKAALGYPDTSRTIGGVWFKVNDLGLPKKLPRLSQSLREGNHVTLNVFNLVYLFRLRPDTDVSSITSPYTGTLDQQSPSIVSYKTFVMKHCPKLEPSEVRPHLSVKAGPNGGPAILTCVQDAYASNMSPCSDHSFKEWCRNTSQDDLLDMYNRVTDSLHEEGNVSTLIHPRGSYRLAKLAFLSDKAGKTRIIYLLDWFRQQLLLPIHDAMMLWFKTQHQDATWDQQKAVETIKLWTKEGSYLSSFDLTAATDRWPAWHQRIAIESAFGSKWADAWFGCLTTTTPYIPGEDRWVSYSIGQPMGAFSSWSALNLTHHMFIRWCAKTAGCKAEYVVLGDDVVIKGRTLGQAYERNLLQLGVTISQGKSVICENGRPSSAEFAKHLLMNGRNLTPSSPNDLTQIYEQFQWWNVVSFYQKTGDSSLPIYTNGTDLWLPNNFNKLLDPLKRYRSYIEIVVSAPIGPKYWEKVPKEGFNEEDYIKVPNPWSTIDSHTSLTYALGQMIGRLGGIVSKLCQLRDKLLAGDKGNILPGYLLEHPAHPLWKCLEALDSEIKYSASQLAQGDLRGTARDCVRLAVDCELLDALLTKKMSFRDWKSKKDSRTKESHMLVIRAFKSVDDLSWYTTESDGGYY